MLLSKRSGTAGTCILADDLTGACDAAVAFASRGLVTEVLVLHEFEASQSEVIAISTGTRDVALELACESVERYVDRLNFSPNLFKKIDSVFRGNTFVEVAAAVQAAPGRFAVIAPAAPHHGRTCRDGLLHILDLSGSSVAPLRERLADAGLQVPWLARSNDPSALEERMRSAIRNGSSVVFCEASTDEDLASVVQAARALGKRPLWIGSSGLAHALAESLHPESESRPSLQLPRGKMLLFSGSNHPVTQRQIFHLRESGPDVLTFRVERNQTTEEEIRDAMKPISPADVACLILNGGDTALHVCRALSIKSIRLSGEFAPGIPMGVARGGRFDGSPIILKSGGFGEADLLTRIAQQTLEQEEQPA